VAEPSSKLSLEAYAQMARGELASLSRTAASWAACCHPALDPASRVTLTVRVVCGLPASSIARLLLASEPAVAQRIVRLACHRVCARRVATLAALLLRARRDSPRLYRRAQLADELRRPPCPDRRNGVQVTQALDTLQPQLQIHPESGQDFDLAGHRP
jgi:hypothetical protein